MLEELVVENKKVIEGGGDEIDKRATKAHDEVQGEKLAEHVILSPCGGVHVGREHVLVR